MEEDGGRNGGILSFSGYLASTPTPRLEGHESDHLTHGDSDCRQTLPIGWCAFYENSDVDAPRIERPPGDSDSIMLLAPVTLGQSFLHLKEEQHDSRTTLNQIGLEYIPKTSDRLDTSFISFSARTSDQIGSQVSRENPRTKTHSSDASSETRGPILPAVDRLEISEEKRVACITLDLNDVLGFRKDTNDHRGQESNDEMPHRSTKSSKNKDKVSQSKKQENEKPEVPEPDSGCSKEGAITLIETIIITEKMAPKSHTKKKKKHGATKPKEAEPLLVVENGARPKSKPKSDIETRPAPVPVLNADHGDAKHHEQTSSFKPEPAKEVKNTHNQEAMSVCARGRQVDDLVKRRRISAERGGVQVRARPQLPAIFRQRKEEEVVKQKVQPPKEGTK